MKYRRDAEFAELPLTVIASKISTKGYRNISIRIVRLGSSRAKAEGLRIGTVRRLPRGVKKEDYARKNIYDVWFPNLAPSEELLKASSWTDETSWQNFKRLYLAEMKEADKRRDIELLAAMSKHTNLSVGCYCESESHCHRSLLRVLLEKAGAEFG